MMLWIEGRVFRVKNDIEKLIDSVLEVELQFYDNGDGEEWWECPMCMNKGEPENFTHDPDCPKELAKKIKK